MGSVTATLVLRTDADLQEMGDDTPANSFHMVKVFFSVSS